MTLAVGRLLNVLIVSLALTSCDGSFAPAQAKVEITDADVPARYAGPLPATSSDLRNWFEDRARFPAQTHSVDLILAGDPGFIARLVDASRKVPQAEGASWAAAWRNLFEYLPASPRFCAAARPIMLANATLVRDVLAPSFAKTCRDRADLALIMREDTVADAVLAYFESSEDEGVRPDSRYTPRLEQAVREIVAVGTVFDARRAALALIAVPNGAGEASLIAITDAIGDPARRAKVAMAFANSKSEAARARFAAACRRDASDPMCRAAPNSIGQSDKVAEARPSRAEFEASKSKLIELGFARVASLRMNGFYRASPAALLTASEHGLSFDVETGTFPNEHDRLLRQLAQLVAPDLNGAVFEEVAPKLAANDEPIGPYQLRAYFAGKLFQIEAQDRGDWYDVDAVLQLLNAMLAYHQSSQRLVPVATGDQTLTVIGGPRAAIDRAITQKIIVPGRASDAEKLGKDFEREVFESLEK